MRRLVRWLVLCAAFFPATFAGSTAERGPQPSEVKPRQPAQASAARLPLLFVENAGQTDERVALYAKTPGGTTYLTADGVTWGLLGKGQRWGLKIDFAGAREGAGPEGEVPAGTTVNYLKGAKANWHAGLRSWRAARYRDLWTGIDLVYEAKDGHLKYSFEVEAGADPSVIGFDVRGAERLCVDADGRLVATTPLGRYVDDRPVAWQDTADGRRDVKVTFGVDGRRVGFRVGTYDAALPLVIDPPTQVYASAFGGAGADFAGGIAVDDSGNAYITGRTTSDETSFPVTAGLDPTFNGGTLGGADDAFVAKINPAGDGFVYVTYLGGSERDWGTDIKVDASGAAYVVGLTASSADFPTAVGPDLTHGGGFDDGFVVKLNPAGTALVYGGFIGGVSDPFGGDEAASGLDLDETGRAYVVGTTAAATGFPTAGGLDATHNGGSDLFVVVVRADGSGFEQAGFLGGAGNETGTGIAVGPGHSIYVCGKTTAATFPAVIGPSLTYGGGTEDGICAKFSATGAVQWAGFWGGAFVDVAMGIDVDDAGNAYLAGYTSSTETTGFPVVNATDGIANGSFDACYARVKADGTGFDVSSFLGGSGSDTGVAIRVVPAGPAAKRGSARAGEVQASTSVALCGGCDATQGFPCGVVLPGNPAETGKDAFVAWLFFGDGPPTLRTSACIGNAEPEGVCPFLQATSECSDCAFVVGSTLSASTSLTSLCGPCDTAPGIFVAKVDAGAASGGGGTNYLAPLTASARFDAKDPRDSKFISTGALDVGFAGIKGTEPMTWTINGHEFYLGAQATRSLANGGVESIHGTNSTVPPFFGIQVKTTRPSPNSSRVEFVAVYDGDLTGLMQPDGEVTMEISQDSGASAVVQLAGGCLTPSKGGCSGKRGMGVVVEPKVAPVSLFSDLKGRRRLSAKFQLAGDGTVPAVPPDLHIEIGTGLALDVAGNELVQKGKTFVWTGPLPGSGGAGASATVKLRYPSKLITVDATGVTVVNDPEVATAVRIVVGIGSDVRSFQPTLRRLLRRLVY